MKPLNNPEAGRGPVSAAHLAGFFWLWLALSCSGDWTHVEDYSYGWFAFALAVYFLWKRVSASPREEASQGAARVCWVVLGAACAVVLPLELLRQTPIYWRVFHWAIYGCAAAATFAAAFLHGGRPLLRACGFPVLFLAAAVPWPTVIEQPLTLGLMHAIAAAMGEFLPLIGIPAQRQGTILVLENCSVGVEEACSGIRSLQSAVMLALAAGEFFHLRAWGRVAVFAASFALAFVANTGRTFALTMAGLAGGNAAIGGIHDAAGLGALGFLGLGTFVCAWALSGVAAGRSPPEHVERSGAVVLRRGPAAACAILAVAGFLLAHAWFVWNEWKRGAEPVGEALAVASGIEEKPLTPALEATLQPSRGGFLRGEAAPGVPANGYHFFWDEDRASAEKFYHRPDVCMPGGGWTLDGPVTGIETHGGRVRWLALPYAREGRRGLLLWSSWLDGEPLALDLASGGTTQQRTLMGLLANGRRKFAIEVAAVLVPYDGDTPPFELARRAAGRFFVEKP